MAYQSYSSQYTAYPDGQGVYGSSHGAPQYQGTSYIGHGGYGSSEEHGGLNGQSQGWTGCQGGPQQDNHFAADRWATQSSPGSDSQQGVNGAPYGSQGQTTSPAYGPSTPQTYDVQTGQPYASGWYQVHQSQSYAQQYAQQYDQQYGHGTAQNTSYAFDASTSQPPVCQACGWADGYCNTCMVQHYEQNYYNQPSQATPSFGAGFPSNAGVNGSATSSKPSGPNTPSNSNFPMTSAPMANALMAANPAAAPNKPQTPNKVKTHGKGWIANTIAGVTSSAAGIASAVVGGLQLGKD